MENTTVRKRKGGIPANQVKDHFDYDPIAGVLTRKKFCHHGPKGELGTVNQYGYRYYSIGQQKYLAHRLAWACVHGEWPRHRVTFLNGNKKDIRLENIVVWDRLIKSKYDHSTKEGRLAWRRDDRAVNPGRYKQHQLMGKFKMTLAEYTAIATSQNNCCAICEKEETATFKGKLRALAVDHNHQTGAIRGLLCANCNSLIGHAKENEDILVSAIKYLQIHNGTRKTFVPVLVKNEPSAG